MPELVAAVADADWYVRNNAALALQEATGVDFGTHAKRWKAWWQSTGRALWDKSTSSGGPAPRPTPKPE
jgi:hypothetical protein